MPRDHEFFISHSATCGHPIYAGPDFHGRLEDLELSQCGDVEWIYDPYAKEARKATSRDRADLVLRVREFLAAEEAVGE